MNLFVLGINHKTAPIELREKFAVSGERYQRLNESLRDHSTLLEQAILSTCNRTEIYGVASDSQEAYNRSIEGLSRLTDLPLKSFKDRVYFKTQSETVAHLFEVAAGLDSMVLGETEVLGQVKEAYLKAQSQHLTGKVLNLLFQRSLSIGKKVRSQTGIGLGKISVASIAVDLSRKIFLKLSSKTILLIGSGEMAQLIVQSLVSNGVTQLTIAGRSSDRREALASRYGVGEIPLEGVDRLIPKVDILIVSTSAPHILISKEKAEGWMKEKRAQSLFVVDLSVPRNVEPRAGDIDDVYLYNLDDLKLIADKNTELRQNAVGECRKIIADATLAFMQKIGQNGFQQRS